MDITEFPRKQEVKTGAGTWSRMFTTPGDTELTGAFGAVAAAGGSGFTRRLYFSKVPGGKPIKQIYKRKGKKVNAADVSGNEISLPWTLGDESDLATQVKLEPHSTYYLNCEQKAFSDHAPPTASATMWLSASHS